MVEGYEAKDEDAFFWSVTKKDDAAGRSWEVQLTLKRASNVYEQLGCTY